MSKQKLISPHFLLRLLLLLLLLPRGLSLLSLSLQMAGRLASLGPSRFLAGSRLLSTASTATIATAKADYRSQVLTKDEVKSYDKDGFLVLEDLLTPAEKQALFQWTSEIQAWKETKGEPPPLSSSYPAATPPPDSTWACDLSSVGCSLTNRKVVSLL